MKFTLHDSEFSPSIYTVQEISVDAIDEEYMSTIVKLPD
jgi:hypothetical protein